MRREVGGQVSDILILIFFHLRPSVINWAIMSSGSTHAERLEMRLEGVVQYREVARMRTRVANGPTSEGDTVGDLVGSKLGFSLGAEVGFRVGSKVGLSLGSEVGCLLGSGVGLRVGSLLGTRLPVGPTLTLGASDG